MPKPDKRNRPKQPKDGTLTRLREVTALANDSKRLAAEIKRCTARLNDLFHDAALLGLKIEIETGETYLNALHDENVRQPAVFFKCRVYVEMIGD